MLGMPGSKKEHNFIANKFMRLNLVKIQVQGNNRLKEREKHHSLILNEQFK